MPVLPPYVRPTDRAAELVLAPTWRAGDWNSHGVDCPFVFRRGGKLGMTVVGWDGIGYQTGLAWHDGQAWSGLQLVLPRDPASEHRRYNTALTSIMRDNDLTGDGELLTVDGWYYGTYHAYPQVGYEHGSAVIGIVRSRDLRHWEEYGELLRPEDGAGWERGGLYKSWLLRHDGRYWLFYNAKDRDDGRWVEQTGAAVSDDLVRWRRVSDEPLLPHGGPGTPDERFASDPCVLRAPDGTWVMFYFGLGGDGHARELAAVSDDLLTWTKTGDVLVDVGAAGGIDDWHAHKPAVIRHHDRLHHYYCAVHRLEAPVDVGGYALPERRGIAVAWSSL
ncbi:family 43 glycosylhydrolase [Jiangella gansuensis]|uniref:family 43 glycosylhydrolase n=1 Tax=Jiangella gansuensis TaxID=281473 RepID=UPI0004ADA914|nr:family 43 glycosylhydrolase [Jiangella gansuensis]